ncbi:MFS transporter [Pollutimonas subterranea]|uniref:MFS transporter n=1 Tax=Pollutimonas subterranea TaxID=2045210 RepID=A0A2N4U4A6_9BURK|nr:tripartite tricarboxylate transporter substrate binding protein [Pollutimonas subterranea]PLC49852.1 MFS transporter [Pollutimonas subterranea]
MNLMTRILSACTLSAVTATAAFAQNADYPNQPIKIVVPFAPGGSTDTLIRMIGPELAEKLGKTVVVENKPGASATLGAGYVARAQPDGHTLLAASAHHTIAQAVLPKLNYHIEQSLTPVGTIALVPNMVVVNSSLGVNNVDEFVALTKAHPDRYNYGSAGTGSAHHLIGEMFKMRTGAQLTHIPYNGSAPAVLGLLSGQVSVMFDTVTSALPHVQAGSTTALAATTGKRSSALPDVPTLAEAGLTGFDVGTWFGLMVPAGTDPQIVQRLNRDVMAIINDPTFQKKLLAQGIEPMSSTADEMKQRISTEVQEFGDLAAKANLKAE